MKPQETEEKQGGLMWLGVTGVGAGESWPPSTFARQGSVGGVAAVGRGGWGGVNGFSRELII